jgi:hypothetical protein
MSVNKLRPHILVLPEDDANRQIANGFVQNYNLNDRAIQILPIANGWLKVVEKFKSDHLQNMYRYPDRVMILLIDCDNHINRINDTKLNEIPPDLHDRVFILGVKSEPEKLKQNVSGGFEAVGTNLSNDCVNNTSNAWGHELLVHNAVELNLMTPKVRLILFPNV